MPPTKSHAAAGSLVLSIASCVVYSVMSNVMVLTNRYLLGKKYYGFDEKFFVVAVQAAVAVLVLELAKMQKLISYDPYDAKIARKWAPVTFFFVAMLYTGMQATAGLPIHIVTVFKNVTNIIIVFGEWRFFGERVGGLVLVSLGVMLMGAVMSSYSDVGGKATPSTLSGYFWMFLNCAATAGYVLYMRYATSRSSLKISKFGMAFYNNLISLPLLAPRSCSTARPSRSGATRCSATSTSPCCSSSAACWASASTSPPSGVSRSRPPLRTFPTLSLSLSNRIAVHLDLC